MYLNIWEETGDESVECRALRKFLRQIELHKTGASCVAALPGALMDTLLSFLLSNSEVSSLLLKLQPFRIKYSLPFYCT